jgi:hypothetical protein
MVPEDFQAIQKYFPRWKKPQIQEIALLSPNHQQYSYLKQLYPTAALHVCTIKSWNLNNHSSRHYDLVCAMNVFHYAKDPALWLGNVLDCCRIFWLQDLVNRYRGGYPRQLGADGDAMRYSLLPKVKSTFEGAFDLSTYRELMEFHTYKADGKNLHFICQMRGHAKPEDIEHSGRATTALDAVAAQAVFRIKGVGLLLKQHVQKSGSG